MGKLIDKKQTYQTLSEYYHHTSTLQHMALKEALNRVPVVDAVPVIRCRDCKYWLKTKKQCGNTYLLPHFEAGEFCSRAVRRDNAKTD